MFYSTPWRTLKGGISTRTRWKHLCNLRQPTLLWNNSNCALANDCASTSRQQICNNCWSLRLSVCMCEALCVDLFKHESNQFYWYEDERSSGIGGIGQVAVPSKFPNYPFWELAPGRALGQRRTLTGWISNTGRGLESHPGHSFSLSSCGPISPRARQKHYSLVWYILTSNSSH